LIDLSRRALLDGSLAAIPLKLNGKPCESNITHSSATESKEEPRIRELLCIGLQSPFNGASSFYGLILSPLLDYLQNPPCRLDPTCLQLNPHGNSNPLPSATPERRCRVSSQTPPWPPRRWPLEPNATPSRRRRQLRQYAAKLQRAEGDELPFEFRALELSLKANYSLLDTQVISRTRKLTLVNLLPQLFLQIGRT
jgi:hypothetical protein